MTMLRPQKMLITKFSPNVQIIIWKIKAIVKWIQFNDNHLWRDHVLYEINY